MKFFIADAFTTELFGGNPAGVVIIDPDSPSVGADGYPDAEVMRKTAAELRYSETAFIRPLGNIDPAKAAAAETPIAGEFQVRYFTPADEVDLCGHATIASFSCLREAGYVEPGNTYMYHTLAGDLYVQIKEDSVMMDMATPEFIGDITDVDAMKELYTIMGLDYDANIPELERQCAANGGDGSGLKPEMISTGLPDIMMPVASREQLAAIKPDFEALTELSRKYEVVGVHAFTLDGGVHRGGSCNAGSDEVTAYCRNFAPLYDIDEEAATGTSNGALTYYLIRNEIECGPDRLFIQGEAMDRPSAIRSHVETAPDGTIKIQVGGSAIILAEGNINI